MNLSKAKRKKEPFFVLSNQFPTTTNFERLRYYVEDCRFMVDNLAVGAKLTSLLFISFSAVDYIIYPEFFKQFLVLRLICVGMLCGLVVLSKQKWAKRKYRLFASLIPLTGAFFLALMIYLLDAPDTIYYAGLSLCIVGTGTLYQWSSRDAAVTTFIIFGMFLIPSLFFRGKALTNVETLQTFVANCIFMVSTGVLVVVGTIYHYSFRYKEFTARSTMRKQQSDLVRLKNEKIKQTAETLKNTETQLFQSEKMSLLGQLSAGVIHEVANPLNFTNQALDVLRHEVKKKESEPKVEEIIEDMQDGLDRIRETISELRGFAQIGKRGQERFSLHETISNSLRFLGKPIVEANIKVEVDVDESLEITGVRNQIIQVLINLIHNAIHAMADGERRGVLKIDAAEQADKSVLIQIADNGSGISKERVDQIFDPFFTTKDPGEGTGLGLSICYRIIENHAGTIRASSEIGKGTTFHVTVPGDENGDSGAF